MRIWDLHPGYLNRQSLLGEHRELHGIYTVLTEDRRGYSRHPETLRWVGHLDGLCRRHALLVAEMELRGYRHNSPLPASVSAPPVPASPPLPASVSAPPVPASPVRTVLWPVRFVDPPGRQLQILLRKYLDRECGRIPLPRSAQELWAQHKYSAMARNPALYRQLGRGVAVLRGRLGVDWLAEELVLLLRQPPSPGPLKDALLHMWGYVSRTPTMPAGVDPTRLLEEGPRRLLEVLVPQAMTHSSYLAHSTALTDLAVSGEECTARLA